MKISIYPPQAIHELGHRQNQEDTLWPPLGEATAQTRLFVVCDGMGGHDHGEVASSLVASTLGRLLGSKLEAGQPFSDEFLREAIAAAYDELDAHDNATDSRRMGTTLTLLALQQAGATMAHIGDSRIYHVRPSRHALLYKSRDHSLVVDLYLSGELTRDQMDGYEGRNVITRAMQPHQERRSKADVAHTTDIAPGDYFVLCSDGMLEQLSDDALIALLASSASDAAKCRQLTALTADNDDNHTAYIVHIASVEREPADNDAPNDEATTRCNMLVLENQLTTDDAPRQNSGGWLKRSWNSLFGSWK